MILILPPCLYPPVCKRKVTRYVLQVAALTSNQVLAVYVQFKALVESKLKLYKDPHCPRKSPVRFTQAIPHDFRGKFPVMYVVGPDVTEAESLFGANTVLPQETAATLRNLLQKRKRADHSDEEQ